MANSSTKWGISIVVVSFILIYILSPILAPFLTAVVFAYMTNPIVNRLVSAKVPRALAVLLIFFMTFFIIFSLLFLLLPPLEHQIGIVIGKIPQLFKWMQDIVIPWLRKYIDLGDVISMQNIQSALTQHWQQAGNIIQQIILTITRSGIGLIIFFMNFLLVFVVAFYLLRDWDNLIASFKNLIPRRMAPTVVRLTRECNEVLGAFFRGQLLVMLCIGVVYSFGLSIIGLDVALLIGIIAGVITFIPYLGFAVGLITGLIASFVQFHDPMHLLYVGIVFGIGNVLEGMVLSPLLVGESIGLHPVAVIFAVLAGGQLFGFTGVLLALPVAAIIMVLLRFVRKQYEKSELYAQTESPAK